MIHAGTFASDAIGAILQITFTPSGGEYSSSTLSVSIASNAGTQIRWQINGGAWTTVSGTSTTASVPITKTENDLTAQALDASGNILIARTDAYGKPGFDRGGGGF